MRCPDDGILQSYLDCEATDAERGDVTRHVTECSRCQTRLREMRQAAGSLKHSMQDLNPAEVIIPAWEPAPPLTLKADRRSQLQPHVIVRLCRSGFGRRRP